MHIVSCTHTDVCNVCTHDAMYAHRLSYPEKTGALRGAGEAGRLTRSGVSCVTVRGAHLAFPGGSQPGSGDKVREASRAVPTEEGPAEFCLHVCSGPLPFPCSACCPENQLEHLWETCLAPDPTRGTHSGRKATPASATPSPAELSDLAGKPVHVGPRPVGPCACSLPPTVSGGARPAQNPHGQMASATSHPTDQGPCEQGLSGDRAHSPGDKTLGRAGEQVRVLLACL